MTKKKDPKKSGVSPPAQDRAGTGISGLDDVLGGGFPRNRLFLVEGDPGSGKTTLGLQFLLEGRRNGEAGLYITLSETKDELLTVADSHSWDLSDIAIHELTLPEENLTPDGDYTFFHPSEVELGSTTKAVREQVERVRPLRAVFDSLSELRLLARDPLKYRRQILSLKQYFIGRNCTVLLLDDRTMTYGDLQLQSLAHGVLMMEQLSPLYGAERRRLRVIKLRGVRYRGGFHDFKIEEGGLAVYPRLVASEHPQKDVSQAKKQSLARTGIGALDQLLGGGLSRGTSTLLIGPAGTGKSLIASQLVTAAASRGEKSAYYSFDEGAATLFERAHTTGSDFVHFAVSGTIDVKQVDPAELSPGEFIQRIRDGVEKNGVKWIVIDSLNGYLNAMPEERFLVIQMHELLSYLSQKGVVTVLVMAQHGTFGSSMPAPVDVSYLADTVVMLRYFESMGKVKKAISVVKRRAGEHEASIRELSISKDGIQISRPLEDFHAILSGTPEKSEKRGKE